MAVLNMTRPDPQTALQRHARDCKVCHSANREEIEADFVAWKSPQKIAKQHGVTTRALLRHAHAFGLLARRDKNVRAALAIIIEQVGKVRVTAQTVVQAVAVLSKINANGQWIDRRETVSLNSLFEKMSQRELLRYAEEGTLPQWFEQTIRKAGLQSRTEEAS